MSMPLIHQCRECGLSITDTIASYSSDLTGFALCFRHQAWINRIHVSPETKRSYFELKDRGLNVSLEDVAQQMSMRAAS